MELQLGKKVPVAWHIGEDNYEGGDYHPGTVVIGPQQGGKVQASSSFTDGRGAILIAQPTAGPWEAGLVDGLNTLNGEGGSSHFWMSPSICDEDQIERWVIAMGRDGLNELGQNLSVADIFDPYHQAGETPGYGHVVYGDDGREPRFFKTENFAHKTADQQSMLLVELVQYISDDILHATLTYPRFDRNLGGGGNVTRYLENARDWCTKNSIAIINDYLTGCGAGRTTTTTTTAAPEEPTTTTTTLAATTTTTTLAATTTTTTLAATTTTTTTESTCECYRLINDTGFNIMLEYKNCDGNTTQITVEKLSSNLTICALAVYPAAGVTITPTGRACVFDQQNNEWDCCPSYDISYSNINREFTIGCALQTDVVTLTVSRNGQPLILGQDYTIDYPAPNNCLIITAVVPGTYTFVINGCTYTSVVS